MSVTSGERAQFADFDDKQVKIMSKMLDIRETRITFAVEHHLNTKGERMDFSHSPHIKTLYNSLASEIVLMGSVQSLKMLPDSAEIHTPLGWRKNGDLRVGDRVSTPNGKGAKIAGLQKFLNEKLYKFVLEDGREVYSGADHLWQVHQSLLGNTVPSDGISLPWQVARQPKVLSTSQIMIAMGTGRYRFSIPVPKEPVEKPIADLPIHPYLLGALLGDGCLRGELGFSGADSEVIVKVDMLLQQMGLKLVQSSVYGYNICRSGLLPDAKTIFKNQLDDLGLRNNFEKFIPKEYCGASVEQRFDLLNGLMDTDGTASESGCASISTTSERLAKDLQSLVWSLGGMANVSRFEKYLEGKRHKDAYRVVISLPTPKKIFSLKRHVDRMSERHYKTRTMGPRIVSAEYSHNEDSTCLVLDNDEHLYITNNYVVTHNSEWAIIDHFAMACNGLSIFYVLPKFETRTTYVQNRINRCVESVKEYKKIVKAGFFDSVAMKNFGKGVIKYVGSNVLADFKEFPADAIFIEEVDQCNPENVEFALDRVRASSYQFKRYLGNPKNRNEGIHKYFLRSNQQEWYVPCLKCGEFVETDWFATVVEDITDDNGNIIDYRLRDRTWKVGCRRDINMICPLCGGLLERASQKGKWVVKNPDSSIEGYHISQLCSAINSVAGMWERFRRALNDPTLFQQFFNSDLGLPFSAAGNRITERVLDRCVDPDYEIAIRPNCAHIVSDASEGPCSMGIDVGKTLDVRISRMEAKGRRRLLYVGKISALNMGEVFDLVDRYNVEKAVIDAGPELMLALDFQAESPCDVWLCRYGGEGTDRRRAYNPIDRIVTIDRTEALDRSYSQLRTRKQIFPSNYREILNGEFSEEMCTPVRQIETDTKGNSRYEWTKGKDHQRHADTYDMLAHELMQDTVIDEIYMG